MALMIDQRPNKYQGEGIVWDSFSQNLPDEIIGYNHREVNGREFDFCLLIKDVGLVIIEVKGWDREHIFDVAGVDEIILTNSAKPECSPKKQARSYRFALLNILSDKYSVSPLIFDLVCYPFLSKEEYLKCRLDIVSESDFTLFKEDLNNSVLFGKKIYNAYNKLKTIPHNKMDASLFNKIRQHFEPTVNFTEVDKTTIKTPYSQLLLFNQKMKDEQIEQVIESYFEGTKHFIFVRDEDDVIKVERLLRKKLIKHNIRIDKLNLVIDSSNEYEELTEKKISFKIFNFEIYYIANNVSNGQDICIIEGEGTDKYISILQSITEKTIFNMNQYLIEHADCKKNTLVKAGAGTGKTFSMVSRIAYLCNKSEDAIVNLVDSIAMVTFTNDAADNMKSRLKQMFINYFILTKNPKYLRFIEEIEQMQISTIHKFAKNIIKSESLSLGLGNEFSISSSDFVKEQIYERYLNDYISRKVEVNSNFYKELKIPIHKFKKILMLFSKQLYNKSVDIKCVGITELGEPIESMPFFNEIIEEVIIVAENEYSEKILALNKIDLKECMIILNRVVNGVNKEKCNLKYKYLFIDEFQDTDDVQIDSFLKLQEIIGETKLFVVGDLKQSIYRFRGATIGAFDRLDTTDWKWGEYTLNTNYRTDYRLLNKYDVIFSELGKQERLPYEFGVDSLSSQIKAGLEDNELIRCIGYPSTQGESFDELLVSEIKRQVDIIKKLEIENTLTREEKTIAILVRENWQIDSVVKIVKNANLKNIKIETKVGGDLYQLSPAIDLYKLVLALNNPREPLYLYNLIDSNNVDVKMDIQLLCGKSKEEKRKILVEALDKYYINRMGQNWNELINDIHNKSVLMLLKKIYDLCQPWGKYSNEIDKQRFYRANYELVLEKIIKNYSVDYLTLNVICTSLRINIVTRQEELSRTVSNEDVEYKIICTTIHKSKGLEYGTVIMPFTNQKIDSYKKAELDVIYYKDKLGYALKIEKNKETNSNYDRKEEISQRVKEESRVLYVALTRAIRNFVWFKDLELSSGLSWKDLLEGK